jgi:hypothetical protein
MSDLREILKTALHEPALANTKEATQIRDALTRLHDALDQYLAWANGGAVYGVNVATSLETAKSNVITHLTLLVQAIESIASQKIALSNEASRQIAETVAGGILRAFYVVLSDFVRVQL